MPDSPSSGRAWGAIGVTLFIQTVTVLTLFVPPVLAPVAAADLGVPAASIGLFISVIYAGAMLSGLVGGALVMRFGAIRVAQLSLVASAVGFAVCLGTLPAVILLGAFIVGVAQGVTNPLSAHVLARATPSHMLAMAFSIKQSGVPLGGMLAGALTPWLLALNGWRFTVFEVVVLSLLTAALIEPMRARYDDDRVPQTPIRFKGLFNTIGLVFANARVAELCAMSFVYAGTQQIMAAFLVSYLHLQLGWSLVSAGLLFAVAQIAGVVGRVLWGVVADRWCAPRLLLALLGLVMAIACGATAMANETWPFWALALLCVAYGGTASSWNGVYFAEVARLAPAGRVGDITGGAQFVTFSGNVIIPPLVGALIAAQGSYAAGFGAFAILPLLVGIYLIATMQRLSGRSAR